MLRIGRSALTALFVVAAGCTETAALGPLPVTATVSLAAGEHVIVSGLAASGAVAFPEAGAGGAQYLVVAQFATRSPDLATQTRFGSQAVAAREATSLEVFRAEPPRARAFHARLRSRESAIAARVRQLGGPIPAPAGAAPRAVPPPVGSQRTFKVCGDLFCDNLVNVQATVQWLGQHAAIYVDNASPSGGLTGDDLDSLGSEFDAVLYDIAVNAFGAPTDIDANGVVIVLLTAKVNGLIGQPDCQESFVTGFFYAADIAPGFAPQFNNGEVFYGMVPDPLGVASCPRTTQEVTRILPGTFIHEFQHMISFGQRVLLRPGLDEALWLNEGLSHLAEELAGLHYDSLGQTSKASQFLYGNLYNAYQYLVSPASQPLVTEDPPGSLAARGAAWLFLRYVADRFGAAAIQSLVQTTASGAANVEAATSRSFGSLLGDWVLALYVDDLPGFTPAPQHAYATWDFRTTFAALHQAFPIDFDRVFPLVPVNAPGAALALQGLVASGSGMFAVATQAADGGAFSLTFRPAAGGTLPASRGGQLAVLRLQ